MSPNPHMDIVADPTADPQLDPTGNPTVDPGKSVPGSLDLVLHRIKFLAQRRRLWLRELLQQENQDGAGETSYHSLIEGILAGRDNHLDEAAWQASDPEIQPINAELEWVATQLAADHQSRLAGLIDNFGLSKDEVAVLDTCLALALEPQLERVCSYLQDHNGRGFVTLALVSKLFGLPYQLNSADLHSLKTWRFVREIPGGKGEPSLFEIDPWVCNWLRGQNRLDPILIGKASFPPMHNMLSNWPVEEAVAEIGRIVDQEAYRKVRLAVRGLEGSGRQTFAALVAGRFGLPLLVIDTTRIAPEDWPLLHLHAQRQAYLSGFAICWRGEDLADKHWPQDVHPVQLQFVAIDREQVVQPLLNVVDLKINLKPLTIAIRRHLWNTLVPTSQDWDSEALDDLILRYPTTVGQIALVGQRAAASPADAIEIMRDASRHRLGKLAQLLPAHFQWDDLSLHPVLVDNLKDFVYEAREREQIWEGSAASRLFPQGKGLMALFSGPSGTGKTMTAQVIAASLQQDLFRIDLSNVISKYVGETSKHIDRILSQAQAMHAVLLFDEADTLFGKRTDIKDAHDRFANADTNYLLQAIENYPGVAILATNRKANIDSAFLRRLRFVFEFIKPDTSQRLQLWQQLLGELAGKKAVGNMAMALQQVSAMLDLTGAQIKYAVLSALFVARREGKPLDISHVLKGIERELAKEGKGLSPETERRLGIYKN